MKTVAGLKPSLPFYSLQILENGDLDIGNYFKLLFSLPFLHPDNVQDFFANKLLPMKATDQVTMEFNVDPQVKKFTDYVFRTYMLSVSTLKQLREYEYE